MTTYIKEISCHLIKAVKTERYLHLDQTFILIIDYKIRKVQFDQYFENVLSIILVSSHSRLHFLFAVSVNCGLLLAMYFTNTNHSWK
jgi:hypothetical protein